ncbi:MAG TPA: homoserine O-acetyltransferase [Anaeromyxobacteraceae bacterium]|nr:homoserine O-acetyltransferase [Anaeromyxobacteraceae bacterium]
MPFPSSPPDPLAPARAAFIAPETRWYAPPGPFLLESGGKLEQLQVAFRTWGRLAPAGDNAVVVCHAFTGSADADRWWTRMFGPGRALDPERDFVVCANILGSCYGTTGPASTDPATGRPYLGTFPAITVRDMVRVQGELCRALGVRRIRAVVGGSLGGMQVLEWALLFPDLVQSIVPIAAPARHSAWAIGLSEAQRQAIAADPRWAGGRYDPADPPAAGLAAARMMAMCTYRGWESFEERYGRRPQAADVFAMESYLRYQGQQLVGRFDAATYFALTRAMDTHDVARGRGEYEAVLRSVRQPALVVTIDTDVLYVPEEQRVMARHMPAARLERLPSPHGHDAFLIHVDELSAMVAEFRDRVEGRGAARRPARTASGGQGVSLLVLGKGKVGAPLLDQVREQAGSLASDYDIALRVVGIGDRRGLAFDDHGIDLSRWRELLVEAPRTGSFRLPEAGAVLDRLARLPGAVLVDLTADPALGRVYEEAFRRGIHVVGANKLPLAAPTAERDRLSAARRQAHVHFHYETSVGASLPLLGTLRNLVRTGDRVLSVEGSLSGTAGYLLAEAEKGTPLSLALRWARELGYTEEDPRDDLSGLDSARKAVILARELGMKVDVSDVLLEPLVPPEALPSTSPVELVEALRRLDRPFAARVEAARARGRVLRYLVHVDVDAGRIRVGPEEVGPDHRAARLRDVEAFVAASTVRRSGTPLVVQGAGVGGDLTAGGVITDVLRVASALGVRTGWSG